MLVLVTCVVVLCLCSALVGLSTSRQAEVLSVSVLLVSALVLCPC
jgi:hypothetical protein